MTYRTQDLERLQRALGRRDFLRRLAVHPAVRIAQAVGKDSISPSSIYSMDRARKDMEKERQFEKETTPSPTPSSIIGPNQMKVTKAAPVLGSTGQNPSYRPPLKQRSPRPVQGQQPKTDFKVSHENHPGRGSILDTKI